MAKAPTSAASVLRAIQLCGHCDSTWPRLCGQHARLVAEYWRQGVLL